MLFLKNKGANININPAAALEDVLMLHPRKAFQ